MLTRPIHSKAFPASCGARVADEAGAQRFRDLSFLNAAPTAADSKGFTHRLATAEDQARNALKGNKELSGALKKVKAEAGVMNELNRSLIANQQIYKDQLEQRKAAERDKDATVQARPGCLVLCTVRVSCSGLHPWNAASWPHAWAHEEAAEPSAMRNRLQELREQIRDLMVYLEASSMASGSSDMAGGSAQVAEREQQKRSKASDRGRRRQ